MLNFGDILTNGCLQIKHLGTHIHIDEPWNDSQQPERWLLCLISNYGILNLPATNNKNNHARFLHMYVGIKISFMHTLLMWALWAGLERTVHRPKLARSPETWRERNKRTESSCDVQRHGTLIKAHHIHTRGDQTERHYVNLWYMYR